jgi:hypothetical protein
MPSAMLLAISIAALAQFALYYWRAVVSAVAAHPVSDRVLAAAGLEGGVTADDFEVLVRLHELTPRLQSRAPGLGFVRTYYRIIDMLGHLAGSRLPAMAIWSRREMAVCARYAAVLVDRRLQDNLACAAAMRSC